MSSFGLQRPLNPEEKEHLKKLNDKIAEAIELRTKWLDAKMKEISRLQIGDDIYDIRKGIKLGVITGLYRYHADRDVRYDTDPYCEYTYNNSMGLHDNTSRQINIIFGTKQDAIEYAKARVESLSYE